MKTEVDVVAVNEEGLPSLTATVTPVDGRHKVLIDRSTVLLEKVDHLVLPDPHDPIR